MTSSSTPSPARVQARAALTRGRVPRRLSSPADVIDQAALFGPTTAGQAGQWLCPCCLDVAEGPGQCPVDLAVLTEIDADGNQVVNDQRDAEFDLPPRIGGAR